MYGIELLGGVVSPVQNYIESSGFTQRHQTKLTRFSTAKGRFARMTFMA